MSVPMRPWFSAIKKIPNYIHLPSFFDLTKQAEDPTDVLKRKRIKANSVKVYREKQKLETSAINQPTTADTNNNNEV